MRTPPYMRGEGEGTLATKGKGEGEDERHGGQGRTLKDLRFGDEIDEFGAAAPTQGDICKPEFELFYILLHVDLDLAFRLHRRHPACFGLEELNRLFQLIRQPGKGGSGR